MIVVAVFAAILAFIASMMIINVAAAAAAAALGLHLFFCIITGIAATILSYALGTIVLLLLLLLLLIHCWGGL